MFLGLTAKSNQQTIDRSNIFAVVMDLWLH